ncbi:MAG: hypothetical protein QOJ51_6562, partial [Acidobacteriaceae bacterium]|nr:hypothetical protein [Acidobacteriaceae bacterium]
SVLSLILKQIWFISRTSGKRNKSELNQDVNR